MGGERVEPTFIDLQNVLKVYCAQLRRNDWPELKPSEFYDLFPSIDPSISDSAWPDTYPHVEKPGVYIIFDSEQCVLYIGKASWSSSFGARLSTYFGFGKSNECVLRKPHSWKGNHRFLVVIPMSEKLKFEAPALEEYLITELQPKDNSIGIEN